MTDEQFWHEFRRGLLALKAASDDPKIHAAIGHMVKPIESRYPLPQQTQRRVEHEDREPVAA